MSVQKHINTPAHHGRFLRIQLTDLCFVTPRDRENYFPYIDFAEKLRRLEDSLKGRTCGVICILTYHGFEELFENALVGTEPSILVKYSSEVLQKQPSSRFDELHRAFENILKPGEL